MIESEGKKYTVQTTRHLLDNRETLKGTSKHFRGKHIDRKRYDQIVYKGLLGGLTSFRRKGPVVLTFYDEDNRPFGVLVTLDDNNIIFVITVFRGPKDMPLHKCFIKVINRIILYDYTMKPLSLEELEKSKKKRATEKTVVTAKEDNIFLRAMQH